MKKFFTTKWANFKDWFYDTVIVRVFGKQISSFTLTVGEEGTLPHTITDTHVILTLNGGGKVSVSKKRFKHILEYNTPSSIPVDAVNTGPAPMFVNIDDIEAHNEFINRDNLRPLSTVRQDESYYDKKALKGQSVVAEKFAGHHTNDPIERKIMKRRLGTRNNTKEEVDAHLAKINEENNEKVGDYDVVPMSDDVKKLFGGINNTEEYNPETGPRKNTWKL